MAEEKAKREEERKSVLPDLLRLSLLISSRILDEKARIQREREEAAEAKLQARKTGGFRSEVPDRTFSRGAPAAAEPEGRGPPRLALAGGKPSWRDRMAAKDVGESAPVAPAAAPAPAVVAAPAAAPAPVASPIATPPAAEAPPSQRSGYVPPHLRGAGGAAPGGGWREREAAARSSDAPSRPERTESGSPATGGRYEPPRRGFGGDSDRKASPASGSRWEPPSRRSAPADGARGEPEPESRPPPAGGASDGKYRPGAFKRTER